jgi:phosphoribosylglycinamide formyltransferase-1
MSGARVEPGAAQGTQAGGARIAVLASGRGSNLQAIVDAIAGGRLDATLAGVFSDRPACAALGRVPGPLRWSRDARAFTRREAFDALLAEAVAAVRPDWIVCAGYLRILGDVFVERFRGRILNIHPSLLPEFRGLRTHARAIEAGARTHGASVHFVIPELDAGAVVSQASLDIRPDEDANTLAGRVLALEHPLLVETLRLAVAGRLDERGATVLLDGHPMFKPWRLQSDGSLAPG